MQFLIHSSKMPKRVTHACHTFELKVSPSCSNCFGPIGSPISLKVFHLLLYEKEKNHSSNLCTWNQQISGNFVFRSYWKQSITNFFFLLL